MKKALLFKDLRPDSSYWEFWLGNQSSNQLIVCEPGSCARAFKPNFGLVPSLVRLLFQHFSFSGQDLETHRCSIGRFEMGFGIWCRKVSVIKLTTADTDAASDPNASNEKEKKCFVRRTQRKSVGVCTCVNIYVGVCGGGVRVWVGVFMGVRVCLCVYGCVRVREWSCACVCLCVPFCPLCSYEFRRDCLSKRVCVWVVVQKCIWETAGYCVCVCVWVHAKERTQTGEWKEKERGTTVSPFLREKLIERKWHSVLSLPI